MSEELKAAQARIACLEGEIAKRDEELAACRVAVENCDLFRARIAELEARIVWLECEAQVNAVPVSEAKAKGVVMPEPDFWLDGGATPCYYAEPLRAVLNAYPAAPAADAGIVDMYRHLQKVTPYRFKKIQDASITDGGDVMYFHKDRFDAALLADMAAHCAANGVV